MAAEIPSVPLHDVTQRRYLNYALSVITSRALPDVRDGLKPVQRRILYAMFHDLHLSHDARFKKSAAVVGDVMGKYHPHGDTAIYDTMVRMAQSFAMRYPLVDGHGNFGSLDGDNAAAMRYTEARLTRISEEMLVELPKQTVPWRPNYDGQRMEPIVLPARVPTLLVEGSTGIAVGMATNIPPHNLGEVIDACCALIDDPDLETKDLCKWVKAPDFPTGGRILNKASELREIYENGQGSVRVRGEYKLVDGGRGSTDVVITSIPYAVNKADLVEKIAEIIIKRAVPQLVDVRDESTTDVRIVLEVKKGSDPDVVMAYLFKHTPLQTPFNVNLTCLVPTDNPEVAEPRRLDLRGILRHFLDFRFEVVTKRFEFELAELKKRIHVLEAFEKIYDAVDEAIRMIRQADGKPDAAAKLMKRFALDEDQADAVLEMKLYKLAKLEIQKIREELAEKREEARRIEGILKSDKRRWTIVKNELGELKAGFDDKRRTRIGGEELEYDADAYILHEDAHVIITRDGWVKRQREVKDIGATRVREGDEVAFVLEGNTKAALVIFSSHGSAYVTRFNDIQATTGYGDPVQKLFNFGDGEKIVYAMSLDERVLKHYDDPKELLAVTKRGQAIRFPLDGHLEESTRSGRMFVKTTDGDEVVGVQPVFGNEVVIVATRGGFVLLCPIAEISAVQGPAKGVQLIKVDDADAVLGFVAATGRGRALKLVTSKGRNVEIGPETLELQARGGKGHPVAKRDSFARIAPKPIELVGLQDGDKPKPKGGGNGSNGHFELN